MTDQTLGHLTAVGPSDAVPVTVPHPRTRWVMRYLLPLFIVGSAVALLVYAARDALMTVIEVDVVPVVSRAASPEEPSSAPDQSQAAQTSQREPVIIAQAPGWIEPDPFAITVQPLTSGVVEQVLVLEGDSVSQGDVLVRLIAEDADLRVRRAQSELVELQASLKRTTSTLAAAQARSDELADEVQRKQSLVAVGGVSPGEYARLEHRLRSQHAEVDAARAAVAQGEAAIKRQEIILEEAKLALARTVIHAPVSGVVLSRSVVPGTRIAGAGDGPGEAHLPGVMQLYDPAKLQARADVPLADAAKVRVGTNARITAEILPDQVFHGEVTRVVHLADMQRNTVEVKVRIHDPSPLLKPDMLCRVRFLSSNDGESPASAPGDERAPRQATESSLRLYVTEDALLNQSSNKAQVWVIEPGPRGRDHIAQLRDVTIGPRDGEFIAVTRGLQPGDRLIVNSPEALQPGMAVRPRPQLTQATELQGP